MEIKSYSATFDGKIYCQGIIHNIQRHSLDSLPGIFGDGFFINDEPESVTLMERQVMFDLIDDKPVFTEQSPKVIWNFDKVSKTFDLPNDTRIQLGPDGKPKFVNGREITANEIMHICTSFFFEVMKTFNPYLASKLFTLEGRTQNWNIQMCANFYLLLNSEMANVADKVFSAMGPDYFQSQLNTDEGLMLQTGGKKIQQVIGLPNKVIEFIKRYPSQSTITGKFKILCSDDPNDGILVIDYLDTLAELKTFKKTTEQYDIMQFISLLAELKMECPDIRIPRAIRYAIKQRFFYSECQYPQRYSVRSNMTELFLPPNDVLREYKDYLRMMPEGGDMYPRNLTAAHNICVRNAQISDNPELAAKFENKVKELEPLDYEGKEYIVTHPHTIAELVYEGNTLEHCVATYASTIANGLTRVMFVRKADEPDVPFVTVEIDEDFNLVQIKEKYDIDVTDPDVIEFLKKWVKKKGA